MLQFYSLLNYFCLSNRYAKFGPFKELAMRDDVQAALTKLERAWMPKTINW